MLTRQSKNSSPNRKIDTKQNDDSSLNYPLITRKVLTILLVLFLIVMFVLSQSNLAPLEKSITFLFDLSQSEFFWLAVGIGLIAQTIDGALGMAYGLTSNSFLLSVGATPAAASGAVHVAEIFTTAASGASHIRFKNVDKALLIKILLPGIIGGVLGVFLITSINGQFLKPIVALYLLLMGIMILLKARKTNQEISSKKLKHIKKLALSGGFLDAVGGGGWGPIVTSSLLSQGNNPRKTIGTVNTAEFFVALVTGISFILLGAIEHWALVCGLIAGGLFAAPFAAFLTSRLNTRVLLTIVGLLIIALSVITLKNFIGDVI
jgi:uncharacterized membrane protein YfcA